MLKILDTQVQSAEYNMRFDEALLETLDTPILHLYEWERPSVTHGYFIRPSKHLNEMKAKERGVDLARRPTGGGIVFHIWDWAFSFLLPSSHPAFSLNTLENYQFVNRAVLAAVQEMFSLSGQLLQEEAPSLGADCQNFCMAKPTQYDVMYGGVKVAGAAQRRKSQGYLHQGTVSLALPDTALLEELLVSKEEVLKAMQSYTFAPLKGDRNELARVRKELEKLLADKLLKSLTSSSK